MQAVAAASDALSLQEVKGLQTKKSSSNAKTGRNTKSLEAGKIHEKHQLALKRSNRRKHELTDGLGDTWGQMVTMLRSLCNILPQATDTLKFARTEVSKVASKLDSIFETFGDKGPAIFDSVAHYYSLLWILYFVLLGLLTLGVLFYGLWASGFFGGPTASVEDPNTPAPTTWTEKLSACCKCCCTCLSTYHDTALCFWSVIIIMQIVVLLIFVISLVLCIVAGVQALLTSGCAQVYMLGDESICTETVSVLNSWLTSFYVGLPSIPLDQVCATQSLLTCHMIERKMKVSAILTTVFSFLAAILSLQMLIDSAVLHERAKYRRMVDKLDKLEKGS